MRTALLRAGFFLCAFAAAGAGFSQSANAQAYLETGQTGAQTQIDVNHTTTLYIGAISTFTLGGANYVMKRGSASSADVTFTVYGNTACTGAPLASVTNQSTAFSQNFGSVLFQIPGNVTLAPGGYCTTLTSTAVDQQNEAFFIKGFDACVVLPADQSGGATCSQTIPVFAPNLSVAKAAPSPGLSVGAQSTYRLTITNTGNIAATTARVLDQLPSGLTFVSASGTGWSCSNASGLVTCNFSGSISASGGVSTIDVTVSANAGTGGQTLTNYASIDPTGGTTPPTPGPSCTTPGNCSSSTSTVSAPNLSVVKAAPTPGLSVGVQSTYVLTITNSGSAAATTARVLDQLPSGLTFVSASGTGWTCSNASGLVTCDFTGSISTSGTSTINLTVSANAGTGGQTLTNYASIDPTGGTTPPTPGPSCTTPGNCSSSTSTVSAPNLSVVKAAPTPGLSVGVQSTYVLTITNSGSAAATTARVLDQLPTGLTFVSASGTGWTCSNASGLVTCNFSGSISSGGGTSTLSVVVTANAGTSGQSLINHVSIDPTGGPNPPPPGPSCTTPGSCSSNTSTVSAPNLSVVKAAPTPGLSVGAQSTYALTITNSGSAAATTARVLDQLPSGLTFVSASGTGWTCSNASGLVTCNFSGSISASGGTSTLSVVVTANAGTSGQSLINHVSIDPTGGPNPPPPGPSCTTPGNCSSSTSTVSAPNLSVVKAAPTPGLSVGAQSTYALTITNSGSAAATTARVLDQLPTGLTFVSASGTGWTCSNASGLVTCDFTGSISASGTSTINLTVSANAGTGGQTLTNYASIDPTGGTTPPTPGPSCTTPGNCSSSTSTVSAPNLSVVKAAPTPGLSVGAQSTYALTITNSGSAAATTARVLDQLPSGLTFVSASGTGWTCSNASGLVTCNFSGSISSGGGTSTLSVVVTANAGTSGQSLINHVSIDPTGGPNPPPPGPSCTTPGNCSSSTSTVSAPNLSVVKAAPTPGLSVGAQSTYALTITNSGSAAATTARVLDQLPSGLTFVSASGTGWTCSNVSGLVTCDFTGSISTSGTSTINLTVSANAGTGGQTLTNYASIDPTGGTTPPTPGPSCTTPGNCSSSTSTVSAPNLSVVKAAPTPGLSVGAQSTYALTITNSGSAAATTARVLDQLPSGLTFVSASGTGWTCSNVSGLVTCDFSGSISSGGGTSTLSVVVTANTGTSGQSLTNHVSIDPTGGPNPPPPGPSCTTPGNCSSSTSTVSAPNLSVVKAAPTPGLSVGAQSTYVLTITNSGSAAATTARVLDQLPSGLTFVSASGSGWTCSNASGLVTCNFSGSISSGGGTSTLSVVVTANAGTSGQSLINHVSIDPTGGPNPPPPGPSCTTPGSCSSSTSTVSAPNLTIVKSNPSPNLVVGAQSTYTLTLTNSGSAAATTARVLDQLPAGMTFVSASGTGWTCANANGLVTCNFTGTIAANGGTSAISMVVLVTASGSGQSMTNYASVDPTGGPNPPPPGPSNCQAGSCSSSTSAVLAPNLTIVKATPVPALDVGSRSTYVLTITNGGTASAASAQVKDQLPSDLTFVSAGGSGWSCSSVGGLVTCNFSGTIASSGGKSTIDVVVVPVVGAHGKTVTNHASVDPTAGSNAPSPGPACSPSTSCASVSSIVNSTKTRTEAIVHNFLAKRGDRLASNGPELNRLINRVTDETCGEEVSTSVARAPAQAARKAAAPAASASAAAAPNASANIGWAGYDNGIDSYGSVVEPRRLTFASNLGASSSEFSALPERSKSGERDGTPPPSAFGPSGSGTSEQGRMNLSGSLSEYRKTSAAADRARTGFTQKESCAERKRKDSFDVWFEASMDYYDYAGASGHFGLLKLGIDYKAAPGLLIGALLQFDQTQEKSAAMGYLVKGSGWMAGPYAAMQLAPNLFLDARYLRGMSDNQIAPYLTYTDDFTSKRWLAAARLSGRWSWDNFSVTPSIEYVHFSDKTASYVDSKGITIDSQQVSINRLLFGPEFRYQSELSKDLGLGVHFSVKGIWDANPIALKSLDGSDGAARKSDFHARFDVGATLYSASGISADISLGYEGLGGDGYSSKSVSGRVKVPVN